MIWELKGYNTDSRYDDVRYRKYTSSKKEAELFNQVPKIQFTDSGHGIVFVSREHKGRKETQIYTCYQHVDKHMALLRKQTVKKEEKEEGVMCPFCGKNDFDLIGLKSHFEHEDCKEYNETIDTPRLF